MKKYDEYIVFILGTDNFKLSKFIRANSKHYGIDELHTFCIKIAEDFEESEENKNLSKSQYDALEEFLANNTNKYIELYNKGEF